MVVGGHSWTGLQLQQREIQSNQHQISGDHQERRMTEYTKYCLVNAFLFLNSREEFKKTWGGGGEEVP